MEVCTKLGADPADLLPFEKYAAAANGLVRPSSAARALNNGVPNIERTDRLVQLLGRQLGMEHPIIDATVKQVDARIEANRKKAARRAEPGRIPVGRRVIGGNLPPSGSCGGRWPRRPRGSAGGLRLRALLAMTAEGRA